MIHHFPTLGKFRKFAAKNNFPVYADMGNIYIARDQNGRDVGTYGTYKYHSGWCADSHEEWVVEWIREVEAMLGETLKQAQFHASRPLEDTEETEELRQALVARFMASAEKDDNDLLETIELRKEYIAKQQ